MTDMPIPQISFSLTLLFAGSLVANMLLKFWLASRQIRYVSNHSNAVPSAFVSQITLSAHQKAAAYSLAQTRFGLLETAWGIATTLAWTLLGGLHILNRAILEWRGPGLLQQLALLTAFVVISSLLDLPFSLYRTFVLEQRFGFNKLTPKIWLLDAAKSTIMGCAIGLPLATLVLWMMGATGTYWWLWTWGVWMGFNLLIMLIYPSWIAPWFNQFKPLEDADLQLRVTDLMRRSGFVSKGCYVMDGSKRSAHSNAYFTGFGSSKRVVFYDTLLAALTAGEVDAVLAHELGHFKHGHITKRLASMFALSLVGFALLGWLSHRVWFFSGLGVVPNLNGANDALALLLFMMALPIVGSFTGPLFAQFSRHHEFQADAYAVTQTNGTDLSSALLKLYQDNAATLTPDPVYARFYYSHPPASERLGRIAQEMQRG
jgi:STE24 endopeptidase